MFAAYAVASLRSIRPAVPCLVRPCLGGSPAYRSYALMPSRSFYRLGLMHNASRQRLTLEPQLVGGGMMRENSRLMVLQDRCGLKRQLLGKWQVSKHREDPAGGGVDAVVAPGEHARSRQRNLTLAIRFHEARVGTQSN